jgi:hypothetical protein
VQPLHPRVKLTLAHDGIAEGRSPFLEAHDPTNEPIRATLTSPPHTPIYGGTRLTVDLPAGSSITVPLKPAR